MKRRDFIKNIAAAIGAAPVIRYGAGLSVFTASNAMASIPSFTDYKALVVIQLTGGNDAMNMLTPTGATHSDYKAVRATIAIENNDLISQLNGKIIGSNYYDASSGNAYDTTATDTDTSAWGVTPEDDLGVMYRQGSYHISDASQGLGINAYMPEIADLYQKGVVSMVSNIGTLVEPITKTEIENKTKTLPLFLFAHNHQQRAIQTAKPQVLATTGWAGKVADDWNGINNPVGLNISYSGTNRMLTGSLTSGLAMPTSTPTSFENLNLNNDGTVVGQGYEDLAQALKNNTNNNNIFKKYYNNISDKAGSLSTLLSNAWNNSPDFSIFTAKNSYGQTLFTAPTADKTFNNSGIYSSGLKESFFKQLEAAAKMIKIAKDDLNYPRQIFYISLGGFDSHSGQIADQSELLRALSLAMSDFYKATEEMGVKENILTLTTTEFGRTLKANSDGCDHGWASHSMIMCGDSKFNGGKIFGDVLDDLSLSGTAMYPENTERGRLIPTTAFDQIYAPALKWMGATNDTINTALPNNTNFSNLTFFSA